MLSKIVASSPACQLNWMKQIYKLTTIGLKIPAVGRQWSERDLNHATSGFRVRRPKHLATLPSVQSGVFRSTNCEMCDTNKIQFLTVFFVWRLIALTEELLHKRCQVDSLEHILVSARLFILGKSFLCNICFISSSMSHSVCDHSFWAEYWKSITPLTVPRSLSPKR